jgi:hypothetical protein
MEANGSSTSQEILSILRNPKALHYRIHKRAQPVLSLRQINPVHVPPLLKNVLILYSHLRLGLPTGPFLSGFPTKTLYAPLLSLLQFTCPIYLILFDLITRLIFSDKYESQSSSLCSLLQSRVTSSLLGPNIFLSFGHCN